MMEIATWPQAIRKAGKALSVLILFALAGCAGIDGPSPFMEVYLEMTEARPCQHVWYPSPPRSVVPEEIDLCENGWMRNRIETALLKRFPLGSNVRQIVRYLEMENFTCVNLYKQESKFNADNFECNFDSIEQYYGPILPFIYPRYTFEMKWKINIYYYDTKILWLEYWNEVRAEGTR